MKKIFAYLVILAGLFFLLLSNSCKKDENDDTGSFDEEAQKSYESVMTLQNQSMQVFDSYLATQDTATAKASLAMWFKNDALVEWAKVSAQGVMVKYTNGMCGGLIIDLQRYGGGGKSYKSIRQGIPHNTNPLKNLPGKKNAVILAAFFDEFTQECQEENNNWGPDFASNGFSNDILVTAEVKLDLLTKLNDYGVIDFNTHGVAWPDNVNIEEVLMLTREERNNETTKKYWDDIKLGTVSVFSLIKDKSTIYAIKPSFITKYNDFKKDTILFYGGFCYSALGSWPEIVNSCAAGTYFGFNWIVRGTKCADWAISLVHNMSDHSLASPMTVEQWMSTTPIPKEYWDAKYKKTVKIIYNGYGGLTFWKPDNNITGGIVATAEDGAPILKPGFTCSEYVLKCNLTGTLSPTLGYEWDYGDGSSTYYTINDNLSLYHLWPSATPYTVKVTVTDYSTNTLVKEFKTIVNFVDPNYLPLLKTWANIDLNFGPNTSIYMSNGSNMTGDYFYFDTSPWHNTPGSIPLTWSDSSFFAQCIGNSGETFTIEGAVSADGSLLKHALFSKTYSIDTVLRYNSTLELTNLPILLKDTLNCWVSFQYHGDGIINQTYITRAELKEFDYISQSYITISNIEWPTTYLSLLFTNDK